MTIPDLLREWIKRLTHDILGWGYPIEEIGGDSFQSSFSCKYCEKDITQDSTGAWFHLYTTSLHRNEGRVKAPLSHSRA